MQRIRCRHSQGTDFDLDIYNGRFCRTPDYPYGTYVYFVTIDENNQPAFPYAIGRQWYGEVTGGTVNTITETTEPLIEAGPDSKLSVDSFDVTLTWSAVEGGQYSIQKSSDLAAWEPVGSTITSTGVTATASTPIADYDTGGGNTGQEAAGSAPGRTATGATPTGPSRTRARRA